MIDWMHIHRHKDYMKFYSVGSFINAVYAVVL